MDNQTEMNEEQKAAAIAAAEAKVAEAQAVVDSVKAKVDTLKETSAANRKALNEAKANSKQANAYVKSLGERNDDNAPAYDEGVESAKGWNAEVERLNGLVEADKEARTANTQASKEAKAALSAAKKELSALGKTPKERKSKVERISQNGILFPLEGSKAHIAWGLIEAAKDAANGTPTSAQVKEQVDAYNADPENTEKLKASRVQSAFRKWRKFHGIAVGAPVAAPAEPAPAPAAE